MKIKKVILGVVGFVMVALFAAYNVSQAQKEREMTDLALENVDALCGGESLPGIEITCGKDFGQCWTVSETVCHIAPFVEVQHCKFTGNEADSCVSPCNL